VVKLQGVPTRELRMLIAERRTASIRHTHSVEVEALEPVVKGWALGGQAAVSGAAGEDAESRPWPVRVDAGMRLAEIASHGHRSRQGDDISRAFG
jgi:hypothetical protein